MISIEPIDLGAAAFAAGYRRDALGPAEIMPCSCGQRLDAPLPADDPRAHALARERRRDGGLPHASTAPDPRDPPTEKPAEDPRARSLRRRRDALRAIDKAMGKHDPAARMVLDRGPSGTVVRPAIGPEDFGTDRVPGRAR